MSLGHGRINASCLTLISASESFSDGREPQLQLGNLVQLNSGGPTMIVADIDGTNAICAWRDHDGETHEHDFPIACVHRVPIASSSI
jgi:uncharacterized protein YodC (DUF2158 family)